MVSAPVRPKLHYAWIVAAVTFVSLLAAAGIRSAPGVLIIPLEQEFGWNRATVSLAVSINVLLYGLCGPFAAALMDRFGVRRVMVVALLTISTGAALTTLMRAPWQLYLLWGCVVGTGAGALATVLSAIVANRWFVARRGLVLGVLTASGATGQLIFLPILMSLVIAFGWRVAAMTAAGAVLLVTPVVVLLMRDQPQAIGLRPFGGGPETDQLPPPVKNPVAAALGTLGEGLRSRDFWLLSGSFFICGASTNGLIGTHLIPASIEHGIPEIQAASFLALIGVFDVLGTTLSGWLSDLFENRWLLCWYYSFRGLALLFLPYALGTQWLGLALFIVFYGLDWVATVPPTVRLTADIFGKARVGMFFGWIMASHQLGSATVAFSAGVLRTWLGNYQVSFMASGLLCLFAAGLVLRIGRKRSDSEVAQPAATFEPQPGY